MECNKIIQDLLDHLRYEGAPSTEKNNKGYFVKDDGDGKNTFFVKGNFKLKRPTLKDIYVYFTEELDPQAYSDDLTDNEFLVDITYADLSKNTTPDIIRRYMEEKLPENNLYKELQDINTKIENYNSEHESDTNEKQKTSIIQHLSNRFKKNKAEPQQPEELETLKKQKLNIMKEHRTRHGAAEIELYLEGIKDTKLIFEVNPKNLNVIQYRLSTKLPLNPELIEENSNIFHEFNNMYHSINISYRGNKFNITKDFFEITSNDIEDPSFGIFIENITKILY